MIPSPNDKIEDTRCLGVSGDFFGNVIYKNEQPSAGIVSMKKEENRIVLILTHLFYISHIYSGKEIIGGAPDQFHLLLISS